MGATVGMRKRRSRKGARRFEPVSEINVTPLVDVMLVLLVIFMVTAPLLTVGVPLELPKTVAKQLQGEKEPLTISVDRKGRIFLQDTEIALDQIVPKLIAIAKSGYDERIYVRGDRRSNYGAVMKVMGTISAAGFRRIALLSELEDRT